MNIVELEISGVIMPLVNPKISLTSQVNNIGELKDRQATFTNKFTVKDTPKIQKLFAGLGLVGNTSVAPYRVLKSRLIYNGVTVLVNGNAYITGKDSKGYNITIYDGNIFLFQEIGNKALNELNYSDLDHSLNAQVFEDSFDNVEGYIYGISNNGQFTPTASPEGIQLNYQIPSVFIHTIWDKIFNETSFNYSGAIFETQKFKDLVMTMQRGYNSEIDAIANPVQLHYTGIDTPIPYNVEEEDIIGTTFYTWRAGWFLYYLEPSGILNSGGVLVIEEDSQYTMSWDLSIDNIPLNSKVSVSIRKTTGGGATVFNEIQSNVTGNFNTTESITFQAVAGEHYSFGISVSGTRSDTNPYNITSNFTGEWHFVDTVSNLIDIKIASFIGDMTITDFIKDIMQHFGLMIQLPQGSDTYEFIQMDAMLDDTANAYDWSDKYVGTKKESYQLKRYAQKNRFAYSYLDDNVVPFADGFLNVDNQNLKPEITMLTRPFNACAIGRTLLNNNLITMTPYWEAERDDNGLIVKYNPIDNKNYIAEILRIDETIKYDVTGGLGITFTGSVPRLNFQNLGYNQLLAENYSKLKTVVNRNDVRECVIRFKAKDIRDFDFFRLVYIEQLTSYFYVNKIKYTGEEMGIAEIVKVRIATRERTPDPIRTPIQI